MRIAAQLNPFDWKMRQASAKLMVSIASSNQGWRRAARAELINAIATDTSAPDMIIDLVAIDLELNNITEAQRYYDRFKLVAKGSKLLQFVKDLHERQPPPSLPQP